jgi:hypothetical protein
VKDALQNAAHFPRLTIESKSRLLRIEAKAFVATRLVEIVIPASIGFFWPWGYFSKCRLQGKWKRRFFGERGWLAWK